ncbi:hypothetical protein AAVH_38097 [Aphelenchoides avenae]|nr:hypothetical protein AAVH_38097 [Aphelenchus avenae]
MSLPVRAVALGNLQAAAVALRLHRAVAAVPPKVQAAVRLSENLRVAVETGPLESRRAVEAARLKLQETEVEPPENPREVEQLENPREVEQLEYPREAEPLENPREAELPRSRPAVERLVNPREVERLESPREAEQLESLQAVELPRNLVAAAE